MPPKKILAAVVLLVSLRVFAQNVVINPTGNQNIVQPPTTIFSANNYAGILYVVPSVMGGYNWSQMPSGSITPGLNTVTLASCPAGIMDVTNGGVFQPDIELWLTGGPGQNEAVLVTSTNCPTPTPPLIAGVAVPLPTTCCAFKVDPSRDKEDSSTPR
jgi:hypothetical protein